MRRASAPIASALLALALAAAPPPARAQWSTDPPPPPTKEQTASDVHRHLVELMPLVGYQFGGGMSGDAGEIEIPSALVYGAALSVWVRPDGQAELLYTRQETTLEFRPAGVGGPALDLGAMTVHQFQLGGTADLKPGRVRPYAAATLGAAWFEPEDYSDETLFAATLGAGVRAPLGERFGLRVEGRWIINWLYSSGTIFCGSGGCLLEVSGDVMSQGTVRGGLSVGF